MSDKESDFSEEFSEDDDEREIISKYSKGSKSKSLKKKPSLKQRPKSASGVYGRTSQELWSNSLKNGTLGMSNKKGKRTPTEYWSETLNKTGMGYTPHTAKHNSFSGLKKSEKRNMAYSSTSHYMRQTMGLEKTKKSLDGPVRSSGTPAYKSQEEYYDDILMLKKNMSALTIENSTMKSKVRRLEEDNIKKEKEIAHLLDPSKSEELRRTIGDRKPDSGSMIQSLKQKILKLEHQLKDKETSYAKLQSDLKTTKVEEMKVQMETFYKEIMRLGQLKTVEKSSKPVPVKENSSKIKTLQQMIRDLNEKNVSLRDTNQSLKQDLHKMMEDKQQLKDKQNEYEDMNRKQLLNRLSKMEKKLEKSEADNVSVLSELDSKHSEKQGKMTLEGSAQQRLEQLSERESELLEEVQKLQNSIKRLQMDRVHYKKKCDDKDKEIKSLKRDIEDLQDELQNFYEKDKSSVTPRVTPRARNGKQTPSRRQSSAKSPRSRSRSPSDSSERERIDRAEKVRKRKIQNFTEQRSAKAIQRSWRKHNQRHEEDSDEATELIQSAFRGHLSRRQRLGYNSSDLNDSQSETELDEAAEFIQSNIRGYNNNKERLRRNQQYRDSRNSIPNDSSYNNQRSKQHNSYNQHRSTDQQYRRKQSVSPKSHFDSDDDDADEYRSHRSTSSHKSANRSSPGPSRQSPRSRQSPAPLGRQSPGPLGRQSPGLLGRQSPGRHSPANSRHSSRDRYGSGNQMLDSDDSDDDIVVTSSRGKRF